jgi:hypothetical protein
MTKTEDIKGARDSLETVREKVAGRFYGDRGVFQAIVNSVENARHYFRALANVIENPAIGQEHPWYAVGAKLQTRDATRCAEQLLESFDDDELRDFQELASGLAGRDLDEYKVACQQLFTYKEGSDGRANWRDVPFDDDSKLRLYVDLSELVEGQFEPLRQKFDARTSF